MTFQELLGSVPLWRVVLTFSLGALLLYEVLFRIGRWWQHRTPEEKEGATGMIVGSLLALMAFLLAITMGMASDRYDTRRHLVLEEANSIGTTYLRAGYLAEPASSQSRELLKEYVPLRIGTVDPETRAANLVRSDEILGELWAIAEGLARDEPGSDVLALYIDSLNDTIDMDTSRVIAALYARVPDTVLLLLFVGAILALGMVGFNAGLTGRRSPLTAIVMVVVLGAVITLIIDIDRPDGGTITVSQEPILELQEQINPESP